MSAPLSGNPLGIPRFAIDVSRWPLLLLLILLPIFTMGMFCRSIWTPDEPREIAIAWSMTQQEQRAVPRLGDVAFCEKPPLTYWLAGASMWTFGKSPAVARIPNLFYAFIGVFAIALLARSMVLGSTVNEGRAGLAALAAGVVMGTMELTWQVSVWLASDASLMMGVCVALMGAWRGLTAAPGRSKCGWYLLMHLGLLAGFFSKNAVAWMVPGLALTLWISWERRWSELLRWELWAGFLIQSLFIGAWVAAVASGPDGRRHLEIFFIDNLLGRFITDPATLERLGRCFSATYQSRMAYGEGHANWFGKYFFELPVYVLPWLFLVLVAAWRSWAVLRSPVVDAAVDRERSAWRFAWCIILPNLFLLTVAGTARGIYLAPVLPGCALLVGLWAAHQPNETRALDRHALSATALFIAGLALVLLPLAYLVTQAKKIPVPGEVMLLLGAASVLGLIKLLVMSHHIRHRRRGEVVREMMVTLIALWVLVGLAAPKVVDRWQNLEPVMRLAARYAKDNRLILMNTDETTRAAMYWYTGLTPATSEDDLAVNGKAACLALRKMPSDDAERKTVVAELARKGWHRLENIDIPFGRSYAIFASQDLGDQPVP